MWPLEGALGVASAALGEPLGADRADPRHGCPRGPGRCCRWSRAPPEPVSASATPDRRLLLARVRRRCADQLSVAEHRRFCWPVSRDRSSSPSTAWPIDCSYCRCSWPAPPSAPCCSRTPARAGNLHMLRTTWRGPPERSPRSALPAMALVAASAPQLVLLLVGSTGNRRPDRSSPGDGRVYVIHHVVDHTSGPGARARRPQPTAGPADYRGRNRRNHSGPAIRCVGRCDRLQRRHRAAHPGCSGSSGGGCSV